MPKLKGAEITQGVFSDHNRIKLEIKQKDQGTPPTPNIWKVTTLLKEKVPRKVRENSELNASGNKIYQDL
jgi:hypothetical protein